MNSPIIGSVPDQWTHEDFSGVYDAFEGIFKEIGWINEKE